MSEKLMVCPFCGSASTFINEMDSHDRFWIECKLCEAADPKIFDSREEAVKSWNSAFCWEAAKKSQCIYCGHVGEKSLKAMFDHALLCEKRPDKKLIKVSIKLAEDNLALRKRIEPLLEFAKKHHEVCEDCEGTGKIYKHADPTSGQWVYCPYADAIEKAEKP